MPNEKINPYQSPGRVAAVDGSPSAKARDIDGVALAAWPVVFGLNMIVPALFGWGMTLEHGLLGVCVAAALYLASGSALCYAWPAAARRLILGSVISALSQLFPILHIISGIIALSVAEAWGLIEYDDDMPMGQGVSSEFGGFVITSIVGGVLLVFAGGCGVVLGLLLPQRWFTRERRFGQAAASGA